MKKNRFFENFRPRRVLIDSSHYSMHKNIKVQLSKNK